MLAVLSRAPAPPSTHRQRRNHNLALTHACIAQDEAWMDDAEARARVRPGRQAVQQASTHVWCVLTRVCVSALPAG